ncbi:MAG: DUF721 domain-containing protein [Deltaproteobacteria bacterium]|nr:DUF721 domain-containing protein [Deltaproteobacteria bacterium]
MNKPQTIAEILKKTLEKSSFQLPMAREKLLSQWKDLLGSPLNEQATPKAFHHDTLMIEVSHPTWMQEMHFFKHKILEKIKHQHPKAQVKDLRFTLKN